MTLFPIFLHHRVDYARDNANRVMSRPCALRGDKADLLFFNQAARAKLFSPIKFFDAVIKEANIMPLHAYTSLLHAVKTSQPHVSVL